MRQDQYERLLALEEKLADIVIRDVDPANWSGGDKAPKDMSTQERGDAQWCRRIALGSLTAFGKVSGMIHGTQAFGGVAPPVPPAQPGTDDGDGAEDPLDKEIATAEHEASRLMKRLKDRGAA